MTIINSTNFGYINVNGKTYYNDVIVTWDCEAREIHLTKRHNFGLPEFNQILSKKPDVLIVGTGDSGLCKVDKKVKELCKERKIELVKMKSREAIKKFNEAFKKGKKVAAFIHITC